MDAVFPDVPSLLTQPATFNACPALEQQGNTIVYLTFRWGYAVNNW